jgi:hypothetical protein
MDIQPTRPDDVPLELLLALNNAAAPAVTALPAHDFRWLLDHATLLTARSADGTLGGFLVLFAEGVDYPSVNYRWFAGRYPRFRYVDRVVVAPAQRRSGIGRRLYARAEADGRAASVPLLGCEVNLEPPNPESMAFHLALGFRQLDEQPTPYGARVALLGRELL